MNVTSRYLEAIGPQLTERDRAIIRTVGQFKLVTGKQLERLYFAGCSDTSRARNRQAVLSRLTGHQVLATVGPGRRHGQQRQMGGSLGGSQGYVYTLDLAGQRLAETAGSRPRRPLVWYEPTAAHFLAVTELYVRLVEAERMGRLRLEQFHAEPECWRTFDRQTLKPDAYVQLQIEQEGQLRRGRFFVEVDRANQYGTKISTKLPQYAAFWQYERARFQRSGKRGHFPGVLFLVPTSERGTYLERLIQRDPETARLFRVALYDEAVAAMATPPESR